jgi:hypothetical protein
MKLAKDSARQVRTERSQLHCRPVHTSQSSGLRAVLLVHTIACELQALLWAWSPGLLFPADCPSLGPGWATVCPSTGGGELRAAAPRPEQGLVHAFLRLVMPVKEKARAKLPFVWCRQNIYFQLGSLLCHRRSWS